MPLLTDLSDFNLKTLETILNYTRQFIKIRLVISRLISKTKPMTPNFTSFLKQVNHYLSAVEVFKKIYRVEKFRTSLSTKYIKLFFLIFFYFSYFILELNAVITLSNLQHKYTPYLQYSYTTILHYNYIAFNKT